MKNKLRFILLVIGLSTLLFSCSNPTTTTTKSTPPSLDIEGKIYYETGKYAKVDRIEFTVSGGTGYYSLYYAKSIDDWDYAYSKRSYIGTCTDTDLCTYTLTESAYVSTGWYYYIWAIDDNGVSGGTRWYPQ